MGKLHLGIHSVPVEENHGRTTIITSLLHDTLTVLWTCKTIESAHQYSRLTAVCTGLVTYDIHSVYTQSVAMKISGFVTEHDLLVIMHSGKGKYEGTCA